MASGWWFQLYTYPVLKNHGVKVSWGDDIPNIWKVITFMFQTTNQSLKDWENRPIGENIARNLGDFTEVRTICP